MCGKRRHGRLQGSQIQWSPVGDTSSLVMAISRDDREALTASGTGGKREVGSGSIARSCSDLLSAREVACGAADSHGYT